MTFFIFLRLIFGIREALLIKVFNEIISKIEKLPYYQLIDLLKNSIFRKILINDPIPV